MENKEEFIPNERKVLNPKNDVVFQALFSEKRKQNTEHLVSEILNQKIKIKEIKNEYSLFRSYPDEKVGRLDLFAETEDSKDIIIELQMDNEHNMVDRLLYSNCKKISQSLERGEFYNTLTPVISIGILKFPLDETKHLNRFHIEAGIYVKDAYPELKLTSLQEYHIIDLTKASELYKKDPNNPLVNWCMFLLNPESKEVDDIMERDENIRRVREDLYVVSDDEDTRRRAEILEQQEVYRQLDKAGNIRYGMKEGELKKQKEIAKKMLEENIDIETISRITELSKEEIKKLQ